MSLLTDENVATVVRDKKRKYGETTTESKKSDELHNNNNREETAKRGDRPKWLSRLGKRGSGSGGRKRKPFRHWAEPRYIVANRTNAEVVRVFVDGACSGNEHKRVEDRVGGFGAWCEQTAWQHSGRLRAPCTNNRGELQAVIHVLDKALSDVAGGGGDGDSCTDLTNGDPLSELRIMGDNQYVLNIATDWLPDWRARGYRKADGALPENLELVKQLDRLLARFVEIGRPLSFQWVSAHSVEPLDKQSDLWRMWKGNYRADRLALEGEKQLLGDEDAEKRE